MPVVNERDLEWSETERGKSHFRRKQLSAAATESDDPDLGCSLYELPPHGASWPYHFHTGNAEAMFVLGGAGQLRLDGDSRRIESGDYVPFPIGEGGGHRVSNTGETPLRYLLFSTMREPDVTVYPDSDKLGIFAGAPPGGREERTVSGFYPRGNTVEYWEGE